jgi:hypothetical protein
MTTETPSGEQPAIADETSVDETEALADAAPAVTDTDENAEPKRKSGAEARIDELTRLRREAERDRDYWREHATRQTPAKPEAVEPEKPKPVPKLEDFNYDEAAYQAALTAHVTAEAARQVREEFRKEQEQLTAKQRTEAWRKRESDFAAKTPDYKDKAYYAPISDVMADIIKDSDKGPEIAYYLGNNPDESRGIAQMSERQAAVAIGRIEAKLEKPSAPEPTPKPVSKAPPPPPKIEATDSTPRVSTTSPDSDKLSDDEWVKAEQARIARKVKRNA